jgi:hypothetical protein
LHRGVKDHLTPIIAEIPTLCWQEAARIKEGVRNRGVGRPISDRRYSGVTRHGILLLGSNGLIHLVPLLTPKEEASNVPSGRRRDQKGGVKKSFAEFGGIPLILSGLLSDGGLQTA